MDGWMGTASRYTGPHAVKRTKKSSPLVLASTQPWRKKQAKELTSVCPPQLQQRQTGTHPPFPFFTPMCFCLPLLGCLVYLVYLVCLKVVQHQEKNKLIMGLAKLVPPPLSPVGRWQMQVLCLKKKKYNEWKRKRKKKTGFSIRHEQTWRRIRQQRLAPFYSPMAVWDRQQRRSPYSKVSR